MSAAPPSSSPGIRPWAITLVVAFLMLCLAFPSTRYTFDGVALAYGLERERLLGAPTSLWDAHHLVQGPFLYFVDWLLDALGQDWPAILTAQVVDMLLSAGTLAVFVNLVWRMTGDRFVSLAATALVGLSFGFWFYSIEPEAYAMQTLALVVALRLAWHFTEENPTAPWPWRVLVLALAGTFCLGTHTNSGVFWLVLVFAAGFPRVAPEVSVRERLRAALLPMVSFTVLVILMSLGLHWYGYLQHPAHTSVSLSRWVLGTAMPETPYGYEIQLWFISVDSTLGAFGGYASTLVARFGHRLADTPLVGALATVALAGAVAAWGVVIFRAGALRRQFPRWTWFLVLAAAPMVLLTMVLESWNIEHKIVQTPLLWLFPALTVAAWRAQGMAPRTWRLVQAGTLVTLVSLGTANLLGAVEPGSDPANNRDLMRAWFIRDHTPPQAKVYLAGAIQGYNAGKINILYFGRRQTRVLDEMLRPDAFPRLPQLVMRGDAESGIYVLSELLQPGPALEELAAKHRIPQDQLLAFLTSLPREKVAEMDDGFALYRVTSLP